MKKMIIVAVVVVASAAGCAGGTWSHWLDTRSVPLPVTAPPLEPLPGGPITADLVEPANAHRVALAVWDELDRDQQTDPLQANAKEQKKR